jgi:hypothetical protein
MPSSAPPSPTRSHQVGSFASNNGSSVCLKCSYPRWTSRKGAEVCDACRERHYFADFDRSSHKSLWGTGGQRERDEDVCAFDDDGKDPLHPGACELTRGLQALGQGMSGRRWQLS